jgi:hypothetical protein
MQTNEADEMKARVNRRQQVLRVAADAIDQESLDIWFHGLQEGILRANLFPRLEAEQGLCSARGTGVHGAYFARSGVLAEEGEIDGNHQRLPLQIRYCKLSEPYDAVWDAQILRVRRAAQ